MSKYTKPNVKVNEDRKGYNAIYYAQNKRKLLNKASKKEICKCCGRVVAHMNMKRHMKTKLCKQLYETQQDEYEAEEAEFERIEQLEEQREQQYHEDKAKEYHEHQLLNCYIAEDDDDDDILINGVNWEIKEEPKTEKPPDDQIKKLKTSLNDFFKKMEDLDKRRKDNKLTQDEYEILFKALVEKQAKFKY